MVHRVKSSEVKEYNVTKESKVCLQQQISGDENDGDKVREEIILK